jgi:peroxiredoxin
MNKTLTLPLLLLSMIGLSSCASNAKMASQTAPMMNGQEADLTKTVTTIDGKALAIKEVIGDKPSVLVFYRGGWCPYCNKQLARLRKITKQINNLGYKLIAVSPDKVSKFQETVKKEKLDYTVVSDSDLIIAKEFGLTFKVDAKTRALYKTYGIDLEAASGKTHYSLPIPAIYVLDSRGLVHFNYVNPNYKVRMNEKILLNALTELKLK